MTPEPIVLWVTPTPVGLDECWALDAYNRPPDGLTRAGDLFSKAKYQQLGPPLMVLRGLLGNAASAISRFRGWPDGLQVIPVGSSSSVAVELARATSAALNASMLQIFVPPQGPRLKNVPIPARPNAAARNLHYDARVRCAPDVLLVDDLIESGATLSAAARALRELGAEKVFGLAAVHLHR
jgi:hypothetical protein